MNSHSICSVVQSSHTQKGQQSKDIGWKGYSVGGWVALSSHPTSICVCQYFISSRSTNAQFVNRETIA